TDDAVDLLPMGEFIQEDSDNEDEDDSEEETAKETEEDTERDFSLPRHHSANNTFGKGKLAVVIPTPRRSARRKSVRTSWPGMLNTELEVRTSSPPKLYVSDSTISPLSE